MKTFGTNAPTFDNGKIDKKQDDFLTFIKIDDQLFRVDFVGWRGVYQFSFDQLKDGEAIFGEDVHLKNPKDFISMISTLQEIFETFVWENETVTEIFFSAATPQLQSLYEKLVKRINKKSILIDTDFDKEQKLFIATVG